jgi:hypothetical protein
MDLRLQELQRNGLPAGSTASRTIPPAVHRAARVAVVDVDGDGDGRER